MNYDQGGIVICADEKLRTFHLLSSSCARKGYVFVNDRGRSRRIYGKRIWLGDRWRFIHDDTAKHRHLLLAPAGAGV